MRLTKLYLLAALSFTLHDTLQSQQITRDQLVALTPDAMLAMVATLLVGTPALTFVGAVGAALTASLRRGGLILAILVLPFMIPTLIFGVSAANAATGGTVPFATPFLILVALSLMAAVVGTLGAAAALRSGE